MIFHNNAAASVIVGDCIASLRNMPSASINCCVTSPPYFGLRDYGHEGQIGLEDTPEAYVARLVDVFREVRRVLADDGTLWLNIGDSYATGTTTSRKSSSSALSGRTKDAQNGVPRIGTPDGCKTKDLIGIPWMLAFALRADGWYLRQDIIWNKPNPMPESVRDRCTKAHEYVFLLSKSPTYYYDHESVKEASATGFTRERTRPKGLSVENEKKGNHGFTSCGISETRNRRSVWTVAPRPYAGAHFAVYPPELIEPCILAGCRPGGVVLDPFGGSGTTAGVALANGRSAIMLELNDEYAALMEARAQSIIARKAA